MKMPEFYNITARILPEFYIIIARKIFVPDFFVGGGTCHPWCRGPATISYAYVALFDHTDKNGTACTKRCYETQHRLHRCSLCLMTPCTKSSEKL